MDGDVIRVKSTSPKMIRVNGKFKSTASLFDGNGGNNRGSFSFNVNKDGSSNDGSFEWPDKDPEPDEDETPKPDDDPVPPTPPTPPTPPEPQTPTPNTQLQWDIHTVRNSVSQGKTEVNQWNMSVQDNSEESYIDVPMWAWALIVAAAVAGVYLTITPKGEWLMGQISAIASLILSSNWFGVLKEFITGTLFKFVQKLVFDPSSTQGYSFNILSYILTMSYPDLLGIIGTGFTMLSILAPIIGENNFAYALSLLSAGISLYGIYTVLKDIIYNK